MVGQLTLDQHIGVRIPGGQPNWNQLLTTRNVFSPASGASGSLAPAITITSPPGFWTLVDNFYALECLISLYLASHATIAATIDAARIVATIPHCDCFLLGILENLISWNVTHQQLGKD